MTKRPPTKGHVFISFAGADRETADRVLRKLEAAEDIRCWIAHRNIPKGEEYPTAIGAALEASSLFLLLLTPAAADSPHVLRETEIAFNARTPRLVVQVAGAALSSSLEYFLSIPQRLDVSAAVDDADLATIETEVRRLLVSPEAIHAHLYQSWRFRVVAAVFYAASFFTSSAPLDYIERISVGSAVLAGALIVLGTGQSNALALFTVGFVQPLVTLLPGAFRLPDILATLSLRDATTIGLACSAGGVVMSLRSGLPGRHLVSFTDWRDWMWPPRPRWSALEIVEVCVKITLIVATLLIGVTRLR